MRGGGFPLCIKGGGSDAPCKGCQATENIRQFTKTQYSICKYIHTILTVMLACVYNDTPQSTIVRNTSTWSILTTSSSVSTSGGVTMQQLWWLTMQAYLSVVHPMVWLVGDFREKPLLCQ